MPMVALKEAAGDHIRMLEHVILLGYAREHAVAMVTEFALLVIFFTGAVDPIVANPHAQAEVLVTGEFRGGHAAEDSDVFGGEHCVQDLEGLAGGCGDSIFGHGYKLFLTAKVAPLLSGYVS